MKKKLIAALLAGLMTVSCAATASAAFVDVSRDQWYYADVTAVEKYGIIQGVGGDRFAPNDTLTLAQAITMACRARAIQMGGNADRIAEWYTSVTGSPAVNWYDPYVRYADVMEICPMGQYGTNYNGGCSRLVMAKLFSMVVYRDDGSIDNNVAALPDTDDLDVLYLYNLGILTGNDQYGTFYPNAIVKRSEAAAIINRVMDPSQRHAFSLQGSSSTRALSDFLGMTVGEIAAQHGWNFTLVDGWWYGGSKAMGHPAYPFTMLVNDPGYQLQSFGDLTGREVITMIQCPSDEAFDAVPNIPMDLTLPQLRDRYPGGQFYAGDDFFSDDGAIAQFTVQVTGSVRVAYAWYSGSPSTTPAQWVVVSRG